MTLFVRAASYRCGLCMDMKGEFHGRLLEHNAWGEGLLREIVENR